MRTYAIIDAEIEAKRFLLAILKLRRILTDKQKTVEELGVSKHTARLKRASMDLTRSLAVMRRP